MSEPENKTTQELQVHSSCDDCVFADLDDNKVQTGCDLDRAEKLGVQEKKDWFKLERFCTTYRPQEWLDEIDDYQDPKLHVLEEIHPRVGFFVKFNAESENPIVDLEKTIQDIANQEEVPARYVAVINDRVEYNEEIFNLLTSNFTWDITEFHIVQMQAKFVNVDRVVDEAFTHAKNGWLYVTTSGEPVARDLIKRVHNRVNIELKRLSLVEPYSGSDGMLFHTPLFKFLNGNKTKVFNDEYSDSRPFIEKVRDAASRSNEECLLTWEKFNNE
jgi:hypothetical protein